MRTFWSRLLCILAAYFCLANAAQAFEFSLDATPASLSQDLNNASATAEIQGREDAESIDVISAARSDYRRLLSVLYDKGYYGASINILVDDQEASNISLLRVTNAVENVHVKVTAGTRFRFSKAEIDPLVAGTEPAAGFAAGQAAGLGIVRSAARTAILDWRDAGHAKARIANQAITANHTQSQLSVAIDVDAGPRLSFGDLDVPTEGGVRPERIREIAGLPVGEVFSPDELERASQRLRNSGAFRSVVLSEADAIGANQTLDISAELVDAKPRRIGFGGEIGTEEGLSLSGFWLHRNLFGGAERLRFDGEVSGISSGGDEIDYSLSARFDRPATFNPDTAFFIETELAQVDEPDYEESSARLETGLTRDFSDRLSGDVAIAYRYSDVSDDLGNRELVYLQLPVGLTFDTRDDELNATSGYYIDVEVTPFYETLGSTGGARIYSDMRAYLTSGAFEQVTTALRLQLGSVEGGTLSDISPDMLFFSGGAGTVRGQGYQSLSVDLGGGLSSGGRTFIGASAELRTTVAKDWSLVAFYDAGFIGEDSFATSNGGWHYGAGLGVRYNTGIGPIRLDLATPVGAGSSNNVEFYIGIGQAF